MYQFGFPDTHGSRIENQLTLVPMSFIHGHLKNEHTLAAMNLLRWHFSKTVIKRTLDITPIH